MAKAPVVPTIKASQLMEMAYRDYGAYVNTTRAVPGIDGLKLVQRRMLLALRDLGQSGWAKSSTVIGHCMKYHPHSEQPEVLNKLVKSGLAVGKGNFGKSLLEELPAAAPRYTYVKTHKEFNESVFRLVPYVPHFTTKDAEPEPEYLPVPVPLSAVYGSLGIGVGLLQGTPQFDIESVVEARQKDDPALLRAPEGTMIVAGDLKKIWVRGIGWIQYGVKCYKTWSKSDGKTVSYIEGSTNVFVPSIKSVFEDYLNDETIYLRDESGEALKVMLSRVKGLRKVTDDMVHTLAQAASVRSKYYRMYVSTGGVAHRISLRTWLNLTWNTFKDAVDNWKIDQEQRINHRIQVYNQIPNVLPLIQQGKSAKDIANKLNLDEEVIVSIENKPMRYLRQGDFNAKISQLQTSLNKIKSTTANKLSKDFVKSIANSRSLA